VTGLRARGGFEVNLEWAGGKLERVTLRSDRGGECRVAYRDEIRAVALDAGERIHLDGELRMTSQGIRPIGDPQPSLEGGP
jgi:alpha-L-fucosidase 2